MQAALRYQLRPLVCVGDSAQEKAWGVSKETVIRQMKIALAGLHAQQAEQVIIAYEPIWAIGEGEHPPLHRKRKIFTLPCVRRWLPFMAKTLPLVLRFCTAAA